MLKKQHRLTQKEFAYVWATGRKQHTPHFTIVTAPCKTAKFAVVAGKKIAKTAVERNRLRRQGYGVIERAVPFDTYQGAVIVILKYPYQALPHSKRRQILSEELARILKKCQKTTIPNTDETQ